MITQGPSKFALRILDRLTDRWPVVVPRIFQSVFLLLAGNTFVHGRILRRIARRLGRVQRFDKMLVVTDVNIGDAVIMQSAVTTLNDCFPSAEIDYACNATGATLMKGLPGIRHVLPIFTRFSIPSERELASLREVIRRERYDVVFNMCSFIRMKDFGVCSPVIPLYVAHGAEIVRRWDGRQGNIHISHALDIVLRKIISLSGVIDRLPAHSLPNAPRSMPVDGSSIYLTHRAVQDARTFIADSGLLDARKLLVHADAPFRYTQIPGPFLRNIIAQIVRAGEVDCILVYTGNAGEDFAQHVLKDASKEMRRKILLVPKTTIAAYAALIDACDLFVSADTGPMHIAAARKILPDAPDAMRNSTAIVALYGATDTRMSGYDSSARDHLQGRQQAPTRAFSAPAPCRNISCIAKPGKSCATVRCFDGLPETEIAEYINAYFRHLRNQQREKLASTVIC